MVGGEEHRVITADYDVVVKSHQFGQVGHCLDHTMGSWYNRQVAGRAHLNRDVQCVHLCDFIGCQEAAVAQAVGLEVDHRLGLARLLLAASAVQSNFKT